MSDRTSAAGEMDRINIGEKVKKLRTAAGMTQSALAGEHLTRNMISMIESGAAMPSVETLFSLASALGVPASYLFAAESEEMLFRKSSELGEVYRLISEKNFTGARSLCEKYADGDFEMRFCLVICKIGLALSALDALTLATASGLLESAANTAEALPFGKEPIVSICGFICTLIRSISGDMSAGGYPGALPPEIGHHEGITSPLVPMDFASYLTARRLLDLGKPDAVYAIAESGICGDFYTLHLRGAHLLAIGDAAGAAEYLESAGKMPGGGFYSKYRIICDLERARRDLGDFEAAYALSTKRMDMLGMFSR